MITGDEARAVLAEVARERERPPPSDPSAAGCVVAIVALVTTVLMPFVGRGLALSGVVMLAIAATLGVSGLVGIFGGRGARGALAAEIEESLQVLAEEFPGGDSERMRRAAVRLLTGAYVRVGPRTVPAFDTELVAGRMGDALAYVRSVERFLVERGEIDPVFGAPPLPPPQP